MSHAEGEVICGGKVVGFFEYNGTTDLACTRVFPTRDELDANWRGSVFADCRCGKPPADVILYTAYHDFHWPGSACLACMAIVAGIDPSPRVDCTCDSPNCGCNGPEPEPGHPLSAVTPPPG